MQNPLKETLQKSVLRFSMKWSIIFVFFVAFCKRQQFDSSCHQYADFKPCSISCPNFVVSPFWSLKRGNLLTGLSPWSSFFLWHKICY